MIIVLEGLPASGKTTLADYLRNNFSFYKVNESLGHLGGVNLSDDQAVIFKETIKKYRLAHQSVEKNIIIDRGYVSMLAWDYCTIKLKNIDNLKVKEGWVASAFQAGKIFEPDVYIYMQINIELSLARRPRLVDEQDIWSSIEGLEYCHEYYENFFKSEEVRFRTIRLDASRPFLDIVRDVKQRLDL